MTFGLACTVYYHHTYYSCLHKAKVLDTQKQVSALAAKFQM